MSLVPNIRVAARDLVRELGFMNRTIAGTDLSPSAVHAIVEIGAAESMTSKMLGEKLILEKSTVSRMVKSLIKKDLIKEAQAKNDGRSKKLLLTKQGQKTLTSINQYAVQRISSAIVSLDKQAQNEILGGLEKFTKSLKESRTKKEQFSIRIAKPGQFSKIGRLLVDIYSKLDGFPKIDEQPDYYQMLANVGEFTKKPDVEILVATSPAKKILGAVVYFGDMKYYGSGGTATEVKNASGFRLLGVSPEARGLGVGRALADACIEQAKASNHSQLVIHTTEFMQAAQTLYKRMGFKKSTDLDFMQEDLNVYGFRLKL